MENKSYGQILFEGYWDSYTKTLTEEEKNVFLKNFVNWNSQSEGLKNFWEDAGISLIKYYEEFILDNYLNSVKPIEK